MASRMDEFRQFVTKYPKVRDDVTSGTKSWQRIYEDWVILGEEDEIWKPYKADGQTGSQKTATTENKKLEDLLTSDNIKAVVGYIKKINPDSISKTLTTIQKVLQITQSVGTKPASGLYNSNYNSWWN